MRSSDQPQAGNRLNTRRQTPVTVRFVGALLLLIWSAIQIYADPVLVTYGREALTQEGDADYTQVIYISVPEGFTEPLYLHIFDPDSVADHDLIYGTPNTKTQFSLYGGAGAFTAPTAQKPLPSPDDLTAGEQILQKVFGVESAVNDRWHLLGSFAPAAGELVGGSRVFKLVVEGLEGDDSNLYDVAVSVESQRHVSLHGLRVFTYSPTVRAVNPRAVVEMQFDIPQPVEALQIHNFDAANGQVTLETAFRSVQAAASGQDEWRTAAVKMNENDTDKRAAVTFSGGEESPNDATFYVTDQAGSGLPIRLPILAARSNQRPLAVAHAMHLSECLSVAFDASGSSDPDGDLLRFTWDFGDGTRAEGSTTVHRYPQAGSYLATVTVTDDSGQVGNHAMKQLKVVMPRPPTAEAGPDRTVAPGERVVLDASESDPGDGAILEYTWTFGDGNVATGKSVSHAFTRPGQYTVRLRVRNDSGTFCDASSDWTQVRVNAPPVAEAGENLIAAVGEMIAFNGSRSYDTDGTILSYVWSLGDGAQKEGRAIQHAYDKPGRYQATLTVQDDAGVANSSVSDRLTVVINAPPIAQAKSVRKAAVGEDIEFDGRSSKDPDGEIVEYLWDFGDGTQARGASVVYAYNRPGRYPVTLTVRDNSNLLSSTRSDAFVVVVNAPPVAQAGKDQMVSSSEVHFDGTASTDADGRIAHYFWEFGDGASSSEPAPMHVYQNPGVYIARLTVSDDSGTNRNMSIDTLKIVINAAPIADAGADQVGAPDQQLTFDASGSIDPDGSTQAFFWDFGDGNTASGPRVAHQYANSGTYTVSLMVQDDTGHAAAVGYDEAKVVINTAPVAHAGNDVLAAPEDVVQLSAANSFDLDGKIVSYRWQFSDSDQVVEEMEPRRTYRTPGVYTARVTVTDDSGAINDTAQDDVTLRINHQPKAAPGSDVRTSDNTVTFDASASADPDGDALTYKWVLGDGTPPKQGVRISHTYAEGGTYPVILTVDDGTGLSNAKHVAATTATIDGPPVAVAGSHKTVCTKAVVVFDGSGSSDPEDGLLRYLWDFGDGSKAEEVNPVHTYQEAGVYPVTLTVQDDSGMPGNRHTDRITVKVHESPVAIAGTDQTVCTHTQMLFDGSASRDTDGVVNRFTWDFGDASRGEGERVTHMYAEPGTYRVTLAIVGDQVGECDDSDTDDLTVTVVSGPVARFTGPDLASVGTPITFDASVSTSDRSPIVSYEWDFGDGTSSEGEKVTHTYAKSGQYPVVLKIATSDTALACRVATAQKRVTINAAPQAVAGQDRFVGINQEVLLDASGSQDVDGGIVSYEWDFGDGTTATGMQVRHRYRTSGTFTVVLTVKDDTSAENNFATSTLVVTVNSTPQPTIVTQEQACVGERVSFSGAAASDADGEIAHYEWNFGDGKTGSGATLSHTYAAAGRYQVTLRVDDGMSVSNSTNEVTKIITVNQPPQAEAGLPRVVCPGSEVGLTARLQWIGTGNSSAMSGNSAMA
jgi:PKD repeat protein